LFSLIGGETRLAIGAGYRKNDYLQRDLVSGVIYADGENGSRFGYAELNIPLVGQYQSIAGVRRLEFTAAIRSEDYYNSFGRVTTPKLGLIYDPTADFTLKASWGKSFKTPNLLHQYQSQSAFLFPATTLGGIGYAADATALTLSGGNPNLDPERARTSSASLAFHPEVMPGLEAELTWFHIDYTNRVVLPLGSAIYQALGSEIYAEFVDYDPKASEQAALLASSAAFYNNTGANYDPSKMIAIVDNRYINASKKNFKGIELSG
jgi:outer membrane receptor protein involved in Fe transport